MMGDFVPDGIADDFFDVVFVFCRLQNRPHENGDFVRQNAIVAGIAFRSRHALIQAQKRHVFTQTKFLFLLGRRPILHHNRRVINQAQKLLRNSLNPFFHQLCKIFFEHKICLPSESRYLTIFCCSEINFGVCGQQLVDFLTFGSIIIIVIRKPSRFVAVCIFIYLNVLFYFHFPAVNIYKMNVVFVFFD